MALSCNAGCVYSNEHNLSSTPYNAIHACAADGEYSAKEQDLIHRLGAKFGIADAIVTQIEAMYWETRRIRQKRIELLFDKGMPY